MNKALVALALVCAGWGGASAQESTNPDYGNEANWLCRPGRDDACGINAAATIVAADGSVSVEPFERAADPAIDCFYVYPTVSNDPGINSDLIANDEERRAAAGQFARFASVCRTFAPMYRQVTLTALRQAMSNGAPTPPEAGALAYRDVETAFQHYLDHDNHGRPFVLVGHSQGSRMLQTLVQRRIDGQPLQARMLSALLLGFNLSVPDSADVGGAFQHVALCRSPQQTGCAISFVSFRANAQPPPGSRFGNTSEPGRRVACVNPAALTGGAAPLDSYLGTRGAGQSSLPAGPWTSTGAEIRTAFVKVPGLLSGQCVRDEHGSYLAVTVHGDPGDPRADDIVGDVVVGDRVLSDWGLHLIDVSLVQGDLVRFVALQAQARGAP